MTSSNQESFRQFEKFLKYGQRQKMKELWDNLEDEDWETISPVLKPAFETSS